jgi:DNA end-binding protein Ku
MHFAQELRNPSELSVDTPGTSEKELSMACTLVESMASKWKPDDYQDEYREALLAVLEEKVKSKGKLPPVKAQKAPAGRKVIDLVYILQESINSAGKQKPAAKKSTKHARTRRKAA